MARREEPTPSMTLPLASPLRPMLAKRVDAVPEGEGWIFVTGSLFTVGAAMRVFGDLVGHAPGPANLAAP